MFVVVTILVVSLLSLHINQRKYGHFRFGPVLQYEKISAFDSDMIHVHQSSHFGTDELG